MSFRHAITRIDVWDAFGSAMIEPGGAPVTDTLLRRLIRFLDGREWLEDFIDRNWFFVGRFSQPVDQFGYRETILVASKNRWQRLRL